MKTDLIKKQSIAEVVAHRNRAIDCLNQAFDLLKAANEAYMRASESSYGLYFGNMPTPGKYTKDKEYFSAWAQKEVDNRVWEYLLGASGLKNLMDAEAIEKFREQLRQAPPECTIETISATFSQLNENKAETFVRGLINVFNKLDHKRYKTNDAFRITPKIILNGYLDAYGFSHWRHRSERVGDLCRIMHILDEKTPKDHLGDFRAIVADARRAGRDTAENDYLSAKMFKNGNLHVTIKRQDLLAKANRLIAEHYGATLAAA